MPRPRRWYSANSVYFASARVAEGLPFVPDRLMNMIIKGICARAQSLYPVLITDYLWMLNHFHMLFVCQDPGVVKGFFCYLKGELASAINRLRGRAGPVWQGRTDTPVVLDTDKIIEVLIYLYTNPQSAGLINKIEEYPGVSSWSALVGGASTERCATCSTSELPQVPRGYDEFRKRDRIADELTATSPKSGDLVIRPFAWVNALGESAGITVEEARQRVIDGVRHKEASLRAERRGKPVAGAKALITQSIYKSFRPKKYGRRVFCLSSLRQLREAFIELYRDFINDCRVVYEHWKLGNTDLRMPLAAFAPPVPLLAVALTQISP